MHTFLQQMWKGSNQQKTTSPPWETIYPSISSAVGMGNQVTDSQKSGGFGLRKRPKSIEEELENDPYDLYRYYQLFRSDSVRDDIFDMDIPMGRLTNIPSQQL